MDAEYWAMLSKGPALEPMPKPCHDCAVESGFYAEYTDALAKESKEVQDKVSARWFCHNCPGSACRGNIDRLQALTKEMQHET